MPEIQALIDAGVTEGKDAALATVCPTGWATAAKLLLENGADIHSGATQQGSIFMQSLQVGSPELINLMIKHGANVHERTSWGANAVTNLLYSHHLTYDSATNGYTPESKARQYACLEILLQAGVPVEDAAKYKLYAFPHLAPLAPQSVRDAQALDAAARAQDPEAVRALLDAGVPPDTGNDHGGNSALALAARRNDLSLMEILLKAGADPDLYGKPLQAALVSGSEDALLRLVEAGARTDVEYTYDSPEDTPAAELAERCESNPNMKNLFAQACADPKDTVEQWRARLNAEQEAREKETTRVIAETPVSQHALPAMSLKKGQPTTTPVPPTMRLKRARPAPG